MIPDADVIIQGERGSFDLAAWVESQATETFEIAAITVAELWHGVERAGAKQRAARESSASSFPCLATAARHGPPGVPR